MKTLFSFLLFAAVFCCNSAVQAQSTSEKKDSIDYTGATPAEYPGGDAAWIQYLKESINVKVPIKKKAPVGYYEVVVAFLVEKDGRINEIAVMKDPGYGCVEEVVKVIKRNRKWKPAHLKTGEPVVYRQKQSFTFVVQEE